MAVVYVCRYNTGKWKTKEHMTIPYVPYVAQHQAFWVNIKQHNGPIAKLIFKSINQLMISCKRNMTSLKMFLFVCSTKGFQCMCVENTYKGTVFL